ncbi:conserved protein of unknown function [Pseudomonas sp. JV551A1]|uniref:Uncharacterized protein n=1 Tax=Pseudomonas inefficax TaxID=2078786 RepID=A0AAQ1P9C5_9PSED|nr:conserved protein of unknown function [Pseudomonas sp. JV551A1]SPO60049.1 conserved protein of unknown function [Pseudomonas inefficax]
MSGEYCGIQALNDPIASLPERSRRNCLKAYSPVRQAAIDLKTALYTTIITLHFNSSGACRFRRA